ncbi:MAG: agmatine deiminase family protein [Phycisphaerae bacterium]
MLPLPAEFERQSALLLGAHELVSSHPRVFVDILAAVHRHVRPVCLVAGTSEIDLGRRLMSRAGLPQGAAQFISLRMDTPWVRDYGPLFVQRADGSVAVADLDYKAWAARADRTWDDDVPKALGKLLGLPVVSVPLTISGGNLLSNGDGVCVTTTGAAVSTRKAFAPGEAAVVKRDEAQAVMRVLGEHLGFDTWVCIKALKGEPTGDADMLAAFVAPDVVLVGRLDPAADPVNAAILDDAASKLAEVQTSRGPMKVHRIPMPPPRKGKWRSYTNVIFANGVLLMPRFSDEDRQLQEEALALYARLLPGWRIVGIKSDGLEQADGLLHCLTRHVPWFVSVPTTPQSQQTPRATMPAQRPPTT